MTDRVRAGWLEILKGKFARDSLMTMGAVGVAGCAGLVVNLIIASTYGAHALGVFNLAYAALVIGAQVGAFGVPMAVLKYLSEFADDKDAGGAVVLVGLGLAAAVAAVVSSGVFLLRDALGRAMDSPDLAKALFLVAPTIWMMSVNKTLLNSLNALRRMRAYSAFFGARPVLIVASLTFLVLGGAPSWALCGSLGIAEAFLLVGLFPVVFSSFRGGAPSGCREWGGRLLGFGFKSVPGGLMAELNTRIDILVLGLLVSDTQVGIYSMAAMLVEGLYQLPYVFRLNVDPLITRLYASGRHGELVSMVRKGLCYSYPAMVALALAAVALYPLVAVTITGDAVFAAGTGPFAVLAVGLVVQGGFLPFSGILVQSGRPGSQTLLLMGIAAVNVLGNFALVPGFGLFGAAAATSLAAALGVPMLLWLVRRQLGIRLLG